MAGVQIQILNHQSIVVSVARYLNGVHSNEGLVLPSRDSRAWQNIHGIFVQCPLSKKMPGASWRLLIFA